MLPSFTDLLYISRNGMQTRLENLDIISNNLSNVNTTAYKSRRANFQEVLDDVKNVKGDILQSTQINMKEGAYEESYSPLHLAIKGEGFFAVTLPDNRTAYTRDGSFKLDANRRIVNMNGYPLVWNGQVPENIEAIQINEAGQVNIFQNKQWRNIGTIQLNRFPNPGGLVSEGNNLFLVGDASGAAQTGNASANGFGEVLSHMLETSNVNIGEQLTNTIINQRGYQLSTRAFQQTDAMITQAIALRR